MSTDAEAGNKRRLPTWMQQINSAGKPRNSSTPNENGCLSEEQPKTQSDGSKSRPPTKKRDKMLAKASDTRNESENLQGRERKRRAYNASGRDEGPRKSTTGAGGPKKKLKKETDADRKIVYDTVAPVKQHDKSERPQKVDIQIVSPERSNEEIELTVDDLMIIAKEYVSADREAKHKYPVSTEATSRKHPLSLPIISNADTKTPFQANESSQILSKCLASRCSSHPTETDGKGKEIPKPENIATNIRRTGDAAQDMLDLFLGPLLKKPPSKEQDYKALQSDVLFSIDESDREVRDVPSNEEALMVKKKSSLKDKVAMFLE